MLEAVTLKLSIITDKRGHGICFEQTQLREKENPDLINVIVLCGVLVIKLAGDSVGSHEERLSGRLNGSPLPICLSHSFPLLPAPTLPLPPELLIRVVKRAIEQAERIFNTTRSCCCFVLLSRRDSSEAELFWIKLDALVTKPGSSGHLEQ